jgi:hypothetical protein
MHEGVPHEDKNALTELSNLGIGAVGMAAKYPFGQGKSLKTGPPTTSSQAAAARARLEETKKVKLDETKGKLTKANMNKVLQNVEKLRLEKDKLKEEVDTGPIENVMFAESSAVNAPRLAEELKNRKQVSEDHVEKKKSTYDTIADYGHTGLEVLGHIPFAGIVPDALNTAWYGAEKTVYDLLPQTSENKKAAAKAREGMLWSGLATIPGIGLGASAAKRGTKLLSRGGKRLSGAIGKTGSVVTRLNTNDDVNIQPYKRGI